MTNENHMSWEARRDAGAVAAQASLQSLRRMLIPFPWTNLDEELRSAPDRVIRIVGYGSFLNPDSARRNIPDTPEHGQIPVIAYGATRVFNYVMPDRAFLRFNTGPRGNQKAALNVDYTGDADSVTTGRLLDVRLDDLPGLRVRERGYHLAPVAYVPWESVRAAPKLAYVFCVDSTPFEGTCYVDDTIMPCAPYVALCQAGARMVDEEFERAFLETSWLADRRTALKEWLAELSDVPDGSDFAAAAPVSN